MRLPRAAAAKLESIGVGFRDKLQQQVTLSFGGVMLVMMAVSSLGLVVVALTIHKAFGPNEALIYNDICL